MRYFAKITRNSFRKISEYRQFIEFTKSKGNDPSESYATSKFWQGGSQKFAASIKAKTSLYTKAQEIGSR